MIGSTKIGESLLIQINCFDLLKDEKTGQCASSKR